MRISLNKIKFTQGLDVQTKKNVAKNKVKKLKVFAFVHLIRTSLEMSHDSVRP